MEVNSATVRASRNRGHLVTNTYGHVPSATGISMRRPFINKD